MNFLKNKLLLPQREWNHCPSDMIDFVTLLLGMHVSMGSLMNTLIPLSLMLMILCIWFQFVSGSWSTPRDLRLVHLLLISMVRFSECQVANIAKALNDCNGHRHIPRMHILLENSLSLPRPCFRVLFQCAPCYRIHKLFFFKTNNKNKSK